MSKGPCSITGCERPIRALTLCNMHYERRRRRGEVGSATPLQRGTPGPCIADGCSDATRSTGSPYCEKHYYRLRRNGTLTAKPWHRRGICAAEDCTEPERELGMCVKHAARVRRHADPEFVAPVRYGSDHRGWIGDRVGYIGAHGRVKTVKGYASKYQCIDCGERAHHWSYDHADPDELWEAKKGPYSASPDHYVPRCAPCHWRFDKSAKRGVE